MARSLQAGLALAVTLVVGPTWTEAKPMRDTPLTTGWSRAEPSDVGFARDLGPRLDAAFAAGHLPNLHAVLVARHGRLVLERYFPGADERWGTPLGDVVFGPGVLHDVRSISKSIVGLLYGIALADGSVPAVDAPLLDQFPEQADLAADPQRRRMTVEHALTMTLGTAWDESAPYADARNSEIAMEQAPDRYRFVLDRPMVSEPGTHWTYNGGTTALLADLVRRGTGSPLLGFANARLFQPLGIERVEWVLGSDGDPAAASGLRLLPRDLLRLGQLVLEDGRWGGRQIVPEPWLAASFANTVSAEDGLEYGYQWWLGRGRIDGRRWIAGFGNGGQRLVVIPELDLTIVVLAGNYNQPDAWRVPVHVIGEVLFPALVAP
ncbi:MAG: serine hydrolase [Pseudomonadota bacterium]